LKTVGLLCLMHQCSLPIPARRARLPVLASAAIDIGDQQSIAESLSTFSARMRNLAAMSGIEERPVLILLDELGSGTDPMEGGALGIALLEHFRALGAMVVATTHHDQIRAHALSTPGLASAAMEFDPQRLAPTYRLRPGFPGASAGLEIAERMGLPARIVEQARRLLGEGSRRAAALLEGLRERVEEAEQRLQALALREREIEELEAQRARRAAESERVLRADFERRVERALEEIRREGRQALDRLAERERSAAGRTLNRSLHRAAEAALALQPSPGTSRGGPGESPETAALLPGARVRIASLGQEGLLEEIDKSGQASVLVRGVRVRALVSDLAPGAGVAAPAPRVGWEVASRARAAERIDLIGTRVEEALERLDKFLDDAALAGHDEVRVIHGSGSGRLRAAIGKFLDSHPHVEEHRLEEERPGGRGVTRVRMRS
jgi:DNA mismatch repair protein MutS2